jgi:hypothetical protein
VVLVLPAANGDAEFLMGDVPLYEGDQRVRIDAPFAGPGRAKGALAGALRLSLRVSCPQEKNFPLRLSPASRVPVRRPAFPAHAWWG